MIITYVFSYYVENYILKIVHNIIKTTKILSMKLIKTVISVCLKSLK